MSTEVMEEVELVNIISVSQMRLRKNFFVIVSRLSHHDSLIDQHSTYIKDLKIQLGQSIQLSEQKCFRIINHLKKQFQELKQTAEQLKNNQTKQGKDLIEMQKQIEKNRDQSITQVYQLQQGLGVLKQENKIYNIKIQELEAQKIKIYDQLGTKQNRAEIQKLDKRVQQLKAINNHIVTDLKMAEHKVQKMEIMTEKQQRNQLKKQAQLIKEIQQRIKKQVKLVTKGISNLSKNNAQNSLDKVHLSPGTIEGNQSTTNHQQSNFKNQLPQRSSVIFTMQQQDSRLRQLIKMHVEQSVGKISERLKRFQNQHKGMEQKMKKLKQNKKQNSGTSQNLKQKMNQLKPQITKISYKVDAMQDKLSFFDKKIDQKDKKLNEIVSQQKQNNIVKMQEKIKMLQAQIYGTFKDIKAKLQTKINIADYDTYMLQNDEKLRQINDILALKSDKLEVKKALLFLESKIKEIILVISQEQENEKDALLTKKQLKCISCDKDIDKFSGVATTQKQNWDYLPWKDHAPETLGRFGMTNYGSLSKKMKRLDNNDLPILKKKANKINQSNLSP